MFPTRHRIRQNRVLHDFEAPLGQVLGAMAEETWARSPFSSGQRGRELFEAEHGRSGLGNFLTTGELWSDPDSPVVSAEDARRRIGEEGLDLYVPDSGIRERALDILIGRKREERRRQDILSRSPGGLGAGSLKLATALGVSMLDPLNVAASFVPIVGPARYSAMLARAGGAVGRAGVRARVGAVEGVAGQALVEPLVYGAALQEQADYGLADSFINVAFGSVLGGGLHVGGGALADALARGRPWQTARPMDPQGHAVEALAPEVRASLLRASVAQAVEGRLTNIDGLFDLARASTLRGDLLSSTALARPDLIRSAPVGRPGQETAAVPSMAAPDGIGGPLPAGATRSAMRSADADRVLGEVGHDLKRLADDGHDVNAVMHNASEMEAARAVQVQEIASLTERVAELEQLKPVRNVYGSGLRRNEAAAADDDVFEFGMQAMTKADREQALSAAKDDLARLRQTAEGGEVDARFVEAVRLGRELEAARSVPASELMARVRNDARASQSPEGVRLADLDAAERGDTQLAAMRGDDVARLAAAADVAVEELETAARMLGAEDQARAAMSGSAELATRAQEYGRAVRAAVDCSLRRGI